MASGLELKRVNFTHHLCTMSLSTIFDPATVTRKGLCPVTEIRNQSTIESHSLYFEQHGTGPEKILFIMGYVTAVFSCDASDSPTCIYRLNSSSFAWSAQISHFGPLPGYSAVAFDNRGVGHSGAPRGPYSWVICMQIYESYLLCDAEQAVWRRMP